MLRPLQLRSSPSRDHRAVVVTDPPSGSHSYFHRFHVSTVAIKYVYRISFISMHNSNLSNPFFTSAYTADVNFCGKFPLTTFFSWSAINEPRAPRVFESCNNSTLGAGAGAGGAHRASGRMEKKRGENTKQPPHGSASAPEWGRICAPSKLRLGPQHVNGLCRRRIHLGCQLWRR